MDNTENKPQTQTIFQQPQSDPPVQPEPIAEEVAPEVEAPADVEKPVELSNMPPDALNGVPPSYHDDGKKKYIFIAAIIGFFVVVLLGLLLFLFRRPAAPPTPVTLTWWGLWEEKQTFDPLIAKYKAKNPHITINYEKMTPLQYRDLLLARSANGKGPDIFSFHNSWLPELKEVAAPIPASVLSTSDFEKTFYKIQDLDLRVGNSHYGIPLMIDGLVLLYNPDLLKAAGISTAPTTWVGDIPEIVKKVTVLGPDGKILTAGIAMGTANNIQNFSEILSALIVLNGGDVKKVDTTQAAEALKLYREFAEKNYWSDSMPDSVDAFATGKVAMIMVPTWQILQVHARNPELNFKVAPMPQGLQGKQLSIATYWVEGVSKYSKNQLEAWKFLKFMSEEENLQELFANQSKTRLFGYAYPRPSMKAKLLDNVYLSPLLAQVDSMVSVIANTRTFDNGLNDSTVQYLRNAVNATAQGVSYEEALGTAQQGINQVLTKYGIESQ